jgi:hypothetical protein
MGRPEVTLEELKLFVVTFKGPDPCCRLQVAKNAEEAFLSCFNKHTVREGHEKASCTVYEAAVEGYKITVTPAEADK